MALQVDQYHELWLYRARAAEDLTVCRQAPNGCGYKQAMQVAGPPLNENTFRTHCFKQLFIILPVILQEEAEAVGDRGLDCAGVTAADFAAMWPDQKKWVSRFAESPSEPPLAQNSFCFHFLMNNDR